MNNQRYPGVKYDMPQEQLDYFGSNVRTSQSTAPFSATTRVVKEQEKAPTSAPHRTAQQTPSSVYNAPQEPQRAPAPQLSLSDQLQQYFGGQPRTQNKVAQSNTSDVASEKSQKQEQSSEVAPAYHRQAGRQTAPQSTRSNASAAGSEAPPRAANRVREVYQPPEVPKVNAAAPTKAEGDDFYWSHNAPSPSTQRSVTNEPRRQVPPSKSAHREEFQRLAAQEEAAPAPQNAYSQPRADRQAPMRKSSLPRGTPASRGSLSVRSDSVATTDEVPAPQRPIRAYIPRQAEAIAPVRQTAAQQQPVQQQQLQQEQPQHSEEAEEVQRKAQARKGREAEEKKLRDEEENCTFHPQINNPSQPRSANIRDSPYRSSLGTNAPRDSRGDYGQAAFDKLYNDAASARRSNDSRRMQQKADEAELEINEKYGPRTTAVNPRRSAVQRDVNQEEVFSRLYADAQRYNRAKSEQERMLELKRQEERGDAPFDWNKGKPKKAETTEENAAEDDAKTALKPRRSPSQQKPIKNLDVFERLARPTSVTLSFQKQKEIEEQEKHEKEEQELEEKKIEMEKIARYNWGVPAKSFTFADLESQNAMFVS